MLLFVLFLLSEKSPELFSSNPHGNAFSKACHSQVSSGLCLTTKHSQEPSLVCFVGSLVSSVNIFFTMQILYSHRVGNEAVKWLQFASHSDAG